MTKNIRVTAILFFAMASGLAAQENSNPFHAAVGISRNDPLKELGLGRRDLRSWNADDRARYVRITKFLNGARAAVTTTIDDSSRYVPDCIDALDKYGIKATIAVSTRREPISQLWRRLRQAVKDGHEIGSHSRRHQCSWPDPETFCRQAYSQDEITGSRNDILANTPQGYVWSWVYPCGNCAQYEFIHERLSEAGYLVARNYPDEARGGVLVPDLQTWALDPYNAAFTQVAQKKGGIAPAGRTNVKDLNAKFDEVYENGGVYHFVSHPQWLDYGPEQFYEKHLAHLAGRTDVWYVPLGPLYAYQVLTENTVVSRVQPEAGKERFAIYNQLKPEIYSQSLTLEFAVPATARIEVFSRGVPVAERSARQLNDRWDGEYVRRQGESVWITVQPNTILEIGLQ